MGDAFRDAVEFGAAYYHYGYEAKEEHQGADEAEDVHGLEPETVQEPEREQVKVAIDKTVEPHELRLAELACLMVNALLADACEACILGQIRDVAVHLAIDFDVLDDLFPIGFQSAVEVVQVMYATHLAGGSVEELGGNRLRERVAFAAVHLVSAHQVISVLRNHAIELGYLVGRILQVGIHCDDDVALCSAEAAIEGGALAVVAAELDAVHRLGVLGL